MCAQECTREKHTQENIVHNNNARKKWSQKQEIIIDSAHEKLVRGTQTNLARPVVSATFSKLFKAFSKLFKAKRFASFSASS